jgi:hypothetical protein
MDFANLSLFRVAAEDCRGLAFARKSLKAILYTAATREGARRVWRKSNNSAAATFKARLSPAIDR